MLAAGFGELAAQLGARGLVDNRDPVASVHAVLASHPREWLLLFDNAPDRESVEAFLPPAGPGRVLITSQNPNWPPGQAMDVPILDVNVAAGFLVNRTGDPDQQAAAELAAELGGPTGAGAGSRLHSGQRRQPCQLPAIVPAAQGRHAGPRRTHRIRQNGRNHMVLGLRAARAIRAAAAGLLRLLACYAPVAVPLSLLLQPRPGLTGELGAKVAPALVPLLDDQLAASDAIAALRRYSLIIPAGAGSVSVHRLVQAVTTKQMPPNAAQWRQAAAALLDAAIPADTDVPEGWPACAALLPHAEASLAASSPGMTRLANYLGQRGSEAAALELQQRTLDAQERALGSQHPDTLTTCGSLGNLTGEAGIRPGPATSSPTCCPSRSRPWPRPPRDPSHPAQTGFLDRAGRGSGRGQRPVRGAAAHPRAGAGHRTL